MKISEVTVIRLFEAITPKCPVNRFLRKIPTARFQPALGEPTLCGVAVEVSDSTGLAEAIAPVRIGGRLAEALPTFW